MKQTFAVYAGTFDPFTNGHLDIVRKAADLFEHVTVLFANNKSKHRMFDFEAMMDATGKSLEHHGLWENVCVDYTDGFVADYCASHNTKYLIRGLRNNMDFLYEEEIAKINRELNPNIETIYLRAQNEIISSSMVKTLLDGNRPITKYVPYHIENLILKSFTATPI